MKINQLYSFFKKRLNPPRAPTLITGIFLWLFAFIAYFWLPLPDWIVIWALIITTILLFISSILKII